VGLKSLFSKEGRKQRSVERAIEKAKNSKIKPDDRRPALQTLAEDGSKESIKALMTRLTFTYATNVVADEEEKQYVFSVLVSFGEKALPALKEHLNEAPTLSWDLQLLTELCEPEQAWEYVADLLEKFDPEYERDPTRKQQLLTYVGDFEHEQASQALVPFVEDHDETVRFISVEGLLRQKQEAIAREPLLKVLVSNEEESLRIKNRICDGFIEHGWLVKGFRGTVEKMLAKQDADYVVDGKGRIKRKKGR
jgi:HEAT repeat protein